MTPFYMSYKIVSVLVQHRNTYLYENNLNNNSGSRRVIRIDEFIFID